MKESVIKIILIVLLWGLIVLDINIFRHLHGTLAFFEMSFGVIGTIYIPKLVSEIFESENPS